MHCYNCSKRLINHRYNFGDLSCNVHVGKWNSKEAGFNYPRMHYDCCGATTDPYDKNHYEFKNPKGCVPIEHCTTFQKQNELLETPYIVVAEHEQWKVSEYADYIRIESEDQMNKMKTVEIRDKLIFLNEEYKKMLKELKMVKRLETKFSYYNYDNESDFLSFQKDQFVPFLIVRRVGDDPTAEKKRPKQCHSK